MSTFLHSLNHYRRLHLHVHQEPEGEDEYMKRLKKTANDLLGRGDGDERCAFLFFEN